MSKSVDISVNSNVITITATGVPVGYQRPDITITPHGSSSAADHAFMDVTKAPTAQDMTMTATHTATANVTAGTYDVTVVCGNEVFTDTVTVPGTGTLHTMTRLQANP